MILSALGCTHRQGLKIELKIVTTMINSNGLAWLASYPKSGNTWTRIFFNCLFARSGEPVDINNLQYGEIASSRYCVSEALGIDVDELSHNEVDHLRPQAYRQLAIDEAEFKQENPDSELIIHKVHDAYSYLPRGQALFPPEATRCAVVLVRNPLDVALSYANHNSCSVEKAVDLICNNNNALCKSLDRYDGQLRQLLWCWSDHVASWLDADIPKLVIRYEDLKQSSVKYFTKMCEFLEIEHNHEEVCAAVEACEFKKIREMEIKGGFKEKAPKVKHFFRKGIVGDWQTNLDEKLVARVIQYNHASMRRLGYLNERDEPLVQPLPLEL